MEIAYNWTRGEWITAQQRPLHGSGWLQPHETQGVVEISSVTADMPGQRGQNITMVAAFSENDSLTLIPTIGPYNTEHLDTFFDTLYRDLTPKEERGPAKVRDNVGQCQFPSFQHHQAMYRILMEFLSPYSPFLNPIEDLFSWHGDGKYIIDSHVHRWPFWLPWIQRVMTSQQMPAEAG